MPNPAPVRQRVATFLSPNVADFLFFETKEGFRATIPAYGTPHPDKIKYPDHKLAFVRPADEQATTYQWFYVAERESQDAYNWEFSKADLGGRGGTKFDAVKRTYITLRSTFDPNVPAMGAAMPNVPEGRFAEGHVLAQRQQARIGDKELDSLFVVDERTYVRRVTIRQIGLDPLNGKSLASSNALFYRGEVVTGSTKIEDLIADPAHAYWGLQADGTQRSGEQLSAEWFVVETSQVVGGVMVDGVLAVQGYETNANFYWPPVLDSFELLDWQRRDGGTDLYPAIRFNPEGYNGPCRNTISRTWSPTPFATVPVQPLQPTRAYYASPFFTLNIPECLHGIIVAQCDIGTTDPVYSQNVGSARLFPATNPADGNKWPASIIADDDQEPFRGGYLRTIRTVYPPNHEAPGSFVPPPPTVWPSLEGYAAWQASISYEFNNNQ